MDAESKHEILKLAKFALRLGTLITFVYALGDLIRAEDLTEFRVYTAKTIMSLFIYVYIETLFIRMDMCDLAKEVEHGNKAE